MDKNMEKLKLSRHAGGNAKWCNHCGKVWQFFKKAKHRNYHMTHTPLLGIYPKEPKTKIQTDPCIPVFTGVALITTAERAETNPSVQQQMRINKIWYVHKMEYYSAIKENEI